MFQLSLTFFVKNCYIFTFSFLKVPLIENQNMHERKISRLLDMNFYKMLQNLVENYP